MKFQVNVTVGMDLTVEANSAEELEELIEDRLRRNLEAGSPDFCVEEIMVEDVDY